MLDDHEFSQSTAVSSLSYIREVRDSMERLTRALEAILTISSRRSRAELSRAEPQGLTPDRCGPPGPA